VTRGLPRVLSLITHTGDVLLVSRAGGASRSRSSRIRPLCFRDDDATSVMTHVDVGIVTITLVASRYRRGRVCDYTYPGVIIHTRVHDHVTSHNS